MKECYLTLKERIDILADEIEEVKQQVNLKYGKEKQSRSKPTFLRFFSNCRAAIPKGLYTKYSQSITDAIRYSARGRIKSRA